MLLHLTSVTSYASTRSVTNTYSSVNSCLNAIVLTEDASTCSSADGTISFSSVVGGSGTYEYKLGPNAWQSFPSFSGLNPGRYVCRVRDVVDPRCKGKVIVTINAQNGVGVSSIVSYDQTDCGLDDGMISITATGGSGDYEYKVGQLPWSSNSTITGLAPGRYVIRVRDANSKGCIYRIPGRTEIKEKPAVVITDVSSQAPSRCHKSNGSITITASGGLGAFQYSIDGGVGQKRLPCVRY